MKCFYINDINDPRVMLYKSLKMRTEEKDGFFIVEGIPSVNALLESEMDVVSCLTTEKLHSQFKEKAERLGKSGIEFYIMEKNVIEELINLKFSHNIMMAAKFPDRKSFEQIEKILPAPHFIVALNEVHDPQNVGMIIRNIAAFGASCLVIDNKTYEPYYRKVTRISLGAVFKINIAYENDIVKFLTKLKKSKTRIIVPTLQANNSTNLNQADFNGDICIVMGNEAKGASEAVQNLADTKIRIPHLFNKVDSLNVACASAIIMHQAFMQKDIQKPSL